MSGHNPESLGVITRLESEGALTTAPDYSRGADSSFIRNKRSARFLGVRVKLSGGGTGNVDITAWTSKKTLSDNEAAIYRLFGLGGTLTLNKPGAGSVKYEEPIEAMGYDVGFTIPTDISNATGLNIDVQIEVVEYDPASFNF